MKTLALSFLVVISAFSGERTRVSPPKTFPNSRIFETSCDAVWPIALRVLTANGWSVKTSDRIGGVLSLDWTRGETIGPYRRINPLVGQYTVEKSTGFWTQYTGFRPMSAQVVVAPEGSSCFCTVTAVYHGREIRSGQGERWWILRSNGFFEDKLLAEIQAKLVN